MARDWETLQTVARNCHCDERTVRRWVARGLVLFKRLPGAQLLIRIDEDGHPVQAPRRPNHKAVA